MKLQPAEDGHVALPTHLLCRHDDDFGGKDEIPPPRAFKLRSIHDYTEDGPENLMTYQMRQDMHAWLTEQGFRYLILADIFIGTMDIDDDHGPVPWNMGEYWIDFADPNEAMFFRFRWGGVA